MASYFPPIWKDNSKMIGLMSMFKNRDVNPHDYDAKMSFWIDLIANSCDALSNPIVSLSELKVRFRRDDRVPTGLDTVITEMIRTKQLCPTSECLKNSDGWLSWTYNSLSKPISWLFGTNQTVPVGQFVHMITLQTLCDRVHDRHKSFHDYHDFSAEVSGVIEYSQLQRKVSDICPSEQIFQLVINQLNKQEIISIGMAQSGEKIIKFRDTKEKGPVRVTETDTNIHGLHHAMLKLEKDVGKLEESVRKYEDEARLELRNGNKLKAKQLLRQKLLTFKKIKEKDLQYDKLCNMMHRLGQTKEQREVLDAYKAGVSAFKQNLDRHGLSPDKIDETMEDLNEALSDHEDISMALSQRPSGDFGIDQTEDLERELDELLEEDKRERARTDAMGDLPTVPVGDLEEEIEEPPPKISRNVDRLERLRRELTTQ